MDARMQGGGQAAGGGGAVESADPDRAAIVSRIEAAAGRPDPMAEYRERGHPSRRSYLEELARESEVPLDTVLMMAEVLGPGEDFDGLVVELEDYGDMLS